MNKLKKVIVLFTVFAVAFNLTSIISDKNIVLAAEENTPYVGCYATKEELMTEFVPDSNGRPVNEGRLFLGRDSSGNPIEWHILGKDTGVLGENTMLFSVYNITDNVFFQLKNNTRVPYDSSADMGVYEVKPSNELYANHYGNSNIRDVLQAMENSIFTSSEQKLLNVTSVKTKDTANNLVYTTSDILYALHGEFQYDNCVYIGTSNVKLPEYYFWQETETEWFWLRTPVEEEYYSAYVAQDMYYVFEYLVNVGHGARPATNLNLSGVSFASSAVAATSNSIVKGIIENETPMTIRFDGGSRNIGRVTYNDIEGVINVRKDSAATKTVSLVVQGGISSNDYDGTDDWYYSKVITGIEKIYAKDIANALGLDAIKLSDCEIWLEITDGGFAYAKNALPETIIDKIVISGVDKPVPGQKLDLSATSQTVGISDAHKTPSIIWTSNNSKVTGNADYGKTYVAGITMDTQEEYVFSPNVTALIDGKTAEVSFNLDGTITVKCSFITEKKPIQTPTDTEDETPTVGKTEDSTEGRAEPSTEEPTEPSTEKATEESIEETTEIITEKETEITEPSTEEATEKTTEKTTEEDIDEITEELTEEITTEDEANNDNGNNYGWIILLVIGIVLIVIIIFLILFIKKKKDEEKRSSE